MKEKHGSFLKAVAVLVSAIAALGAWLFPREATTRIEVAASTSSHQSPAEGRDLVPISRKEQPVEAVQTATPRKPVVAAEDSKARGERLPWEFDLADNEQKVILSGQASVAVQFNNVSGEEFPTV